MARVTYVKKAQQRYKMVPVIDETTGEQKVSAVIRKGGTARVTKKGREVTRRHTVADKSQPLPLLKCDHCGKDIEIGTPYKHITPKTGQYGGYQRNRHQDCPTWHEWEYSSSLGARTAEIAYNFRESIGNDYETPEEVQDALNSAAEEVRSLAEEKRESANNIEEGFQHATYQSDELNETADQLESWADEIEGADIPDLPDPEEIDCEDCEGTGEVDDTDSPETVDSEGPDVFPSKPCETCEGSGQVTPEEPTEEQMDEWRNEVEDVCGIVDDCPV